MFDLSMFSTDYSFGTVGTVAKMPNVPKCPANVPLKNNDLSALGQLGQLGQQKNAISETDFTKSDEWLEAFNERAAIMEYDGGLPRTEAERQAKVICLDEFRRRRQRH